MGVIAALVPITACSAGRLAEPAGEPVPDPAAFVAEVREGTVPGAPQQITFGWTLDEQGSRISGRGVVRTEAPERIRLDLFGPRGETYLTAALVEGEYRLPSSAAGRVVLPSPVLLWAALGVLDPPPSADLVSATSTDGGAEIRYQSSQGEVFVYTFTGGPDEMFRLARVERAGSQGVIETVALERTATGGLSRTRYRNRAEFRDLTLEVEAVREADPFPTNIWRPVGSSR